MQKPPDQAALIEVQLKQDHSHNGELLTAGDTILVDAATAQWLADQGITAPPPETPTMTGTFAPLADMVNTAAIAEEQAGTFSSE